MQNILYADVHGDIAIRSTGYLPVRPIEQGRGLVQASAATDWWTRRIPFEELPASTNPTKGYLHSANQDPTGPGFGYYLGHNWTSTYRSIRIDELLGQNERHSPGDLSRYQSDVLSTRARRLTDLLEFVEPLSAEAEALRQRLWLWDGSMDLASKEATAFHIWVDVLRGLTWDEPEFTGMRLPADSELEHVLRERPTSRWLDIVDTEEIEDANGLLRRSLEVALARGVPDRSWGEEQRLYLEHLTRSEKLAALWRGPLPFPGHAETVSPANTGGPNRETGSRVTHSASWRVVVAPRHIPGVRPLPSNKQPLAGGSTFGVPGYGTRADTVNDEIPCRTR
jgi:penicillin amidase